MKSVFVWLVVFTSSVLLTTSARVVLADCPRADLNGDCRVDLEDFAIMARQWLTEGIPAPQGMVWVAVNDPGVSGHEGFVGKVSKYETTNGQYCGYLNTAMTRGLVVIDNNIVYAASDTAQLQPYFKLYTATTPDSQIYWQDTDNKFHVRSRDGHSMANHPVVMVSFWGAKAFCDFYGYHLPTIWQFEAVADFNGSFTYGCGNSISYDIANYKNINPLGLSAAPYTVAVDYYGAFGYGICQLSGNVAEWTSSTLIDGSNTYNYIRGGSWSSSYSSCKVSGGYATSPARLNSGIGFRCYK